MYLMFDPWILHIELTQYNHFVSSGSTLIKGILQPHSVIWYYHRSMWHCLFLLHLHTIVTWYYRINHLWNWIKWIFRSICKLNTPYTSREFGNDGGLMRSWIALHAKYMQLIHFNLVCPNLSMLSLCDTRRYCSGRVLASPDPRGQQGRE